MLVLDSVIPPRWSILKKILNTLKKLKFWTSSKELQALQSKLDEAKDMEEFYKNLYQKYLNLYCDALAQKHTSIPLLSDYKP